MPGNFLLTQISRTSNKGETTTTVQDPNGSTVETSTEDSFEVTATADAVTSTVTTKEDVGIAIAFELTFKNRQPIPPVGDTPPDACP